MSNFDYSEKIICATLVNAGFYKIEVWGGQGGSNNLKYSDVETQYMYKDAGYGGYSVGIIKTSVNASVYVVVGGKGTDVTTQNGTAGGYNGGGNGGNGLSSGNYGGGGGGGATHIATVAGLLKNLSSYKDTGGTNISKEILIVAGGGGGRGNQSVRGYAGGYQSSVVNSPNTDIVLQNATQTTGYSFGLGQNGRTATTNGGNGSEGSGGGGGGWYGGPALQTLGNGTAIAGSGGSGYIGSFYLISRGGTIKHMYCHSCGTTQTATAYATTVGTNMSATATADYSKTGNGYARITYLGTSI